MARKFDDAARGEITSAIQTSRQLVSRLKKEMEPTIQKIVGIEETRDRILECHDLTVDEVLTCETCGKLILPGDSYHPSGDDVDLCEEHAPTIGDLKSILKRDPDCFEDVDEARAYLEQTSEPDDAKVLSVWEP